jgi:hypothetical protein
VPETKSSETKQGENKRRKRKSSASARRAPKKSASEQLLLTVDIPNGNIVKIEKFGKAGKRSKISEEILAALAGDEDDELDDIGAVIEQTYAAGVADALDQELSDEDDGEFAGQKLIRRGVRKLILRRAFRREFVKRSLAGSKHAAH